MSFIFSETDPDETLLEAQSILGAMVEVQVAQYRISSDEPLDSSYFKDESYYASFFSEFGESSNQDWERRTGHSWDFSKTRFSNPSEMIDGLFKILRSGGAYSEGYDHEKALAIEKDMRARFQFDSPDIAIISIANYGFEPDSIDSGYTVDLNGLGEVSSFFREMAWDDLIFIINTTNMTLYVIAFTDED